MTKFQNYQHYKLPITVNPLEYGKLIYQKDKLFIIQVNRTNIALITQSDNINHIKLFKEGDLIFQYKDIITDVSQNIFVRSLDNKRFNFKNNVLIYTEKKLFRRQNTK